MKFAKILVATSLFVMGASLAHATPVSGPYLTFSGTESASGITSTGVSFTKVPSTQYSTGTVTSSGGFLSTYTPTSTGQIVPYISGQSSVAMKFTPGPTASTGWSTSPVQIKFFTITQGLNTLTLYLTSVTGSGTGSGGTYGYFTGLGYVTGTGITGQDPVMFSLVNTTTGSGAKSFNATISFAPEPTSAALLGTAMLGMAGLMRLRRRATV